MDNRPIGVFDSGLGGLTAVRELKKLLPFEKIIYLGDTGRVPYGCRSRETLVEYARQDISFLLSKDVKMVIAACGTISSVITEDFAKSLPVPYVGVIQPSAWEACAITRNNKVGVIGTTASIRSGSYAKAIHTIESSVKVVGMACPLFVNLVENGMIERDNQITVLTAKMYLESLKKDEVDTLILGCTHFPIISGIIGDVMGEDVKLIDSGQQVARYTANYLLKSGMLAEECIQAQDFYVTDRIQQFEEVAKIFLGESIKGDVSRVDISLL